MHKLNCNLKNILFVILIICVFVLLYRFMKPTKLGENYNNNFYKTSSEIECSTRCNKNGFATYDYDDRNKNNKWCSFFGLRYRC